jgi:transposase
MNSDLFLGWLEYVFVPYLKNPKKSMLIIDNASRHPKEAIIEIAEMYGFNVLFLPKYSPDLNPIETKWANVKNWLCRHMHQHGNFWDAFVPAFA